MRAKLITLSTDFGLVDHFVGVMKGVIAGIAPAARVVDITHEIGAYQVSEGAFVVSETWPYFPKGTIHVVVVDPGVGSARRPLLVEANGHYFVGPDNGVFSMVYAKSKPKVRVVTNPNMMRAKISRTFHGRDVFAPAAAHLAQEARPAEFGDIIRDYVQLPLTAAQEIGKACWRGSVLKVDRFGNLITNFSEQDFGDLKTRPFQLRIGRTIVRRLASHYCETKVGEMFAIAGSSGYLEIAANQASAAAMLDTAAGANVTLELL